MNIPVVDAQGYWEKLLQARRPGAEKILAHYEHRLGVISRDPRTMLIPLDDHLVHRGDGVFETMKWVDGKIYQLEAHLRRMERSCRAIFLSPPAPWDEVRDMILQVARVADSANGMLRVLVGRGPGGFGIDPVECPLPSLHVVAYTFKPKAEDAYETGATAFKTSIPAKQPYLATIKSIDYLPNVLMRREALERGVDYPFCFDANGFLAEGAVENICMVDQAGTVVVPEFTNCLAGTTLCRAVELLPKDISVVFRKIAEAELYDAKELIVVGTTTDAISVVRYEGKPIHDARPGPIAAQMRKLLQQDLQQNGTPVLGE